MLNSNVIRRSRHSKQIANCLSILVKSHPNRRYFSGGRLALASYYDLFPRTFPKGMPPNTPFSPDLASLKKEYINLQSTHHPDRGGDSNDNQSALLSVAYKTLQSPLKRAEIILQANGIDALAEKDSIDDEDLLMDVLMIREAVADAQSADELVPIEAENKAKIDECVKNLEAAFASSDFQKAKQETIKLSYWDSIERMLKERL